MFEHFNTRDAVKVGVRERKLFRARRAQISTGQTLASLSQSVGVDLYPGQPCRRVKSLTVSQQLSDVATNIEQRGCVAGNPPDGMHPVLANRWIFCCGSIS